MSEPDWNNLAPADTPVAKACDAIHGLEGHEVIAPLFTIARRLGVLVTEEQEIQLMEAAAATTPARKIRSALKLFERISARLRERLESDLAEELGDGT